MDLQISRYVSSFNRPISLRILPVKPFLPFKLITKKECLLLNLIQVRHQNKHEKKRCYKDLTTGSYGLTEIQMFQFS